MSGVDNKAARIAELNDQLRKSPSRYGKVFTTDGVASFGAEFVVQALAATAAFANFTQDNDPYGEHDFGSFELDGEQIFWKIDYLDKADPDFGAKDASDSATMDRVLTIMLASEY